MADWPQFYNLFKFPSDFLTKGLTLIFILGLAAARAVSTAVSLLDTWGSEIRTGVVQHLELELVALKAKLPVNLKGSLFSAVQG